MPELPSHIDFLIIGAGPAGTATALALLDNGVPASGVLIVDRVAFPRHKLCGGGVTGRAWERLVHWGIDLESVWDAQGIHLVVDGRGQVMAEPVRLGTVDRWELDHRMLCRVRAAGVRFVTAEITGCCSTADGWLVSTSLGGIHCGYLVGADGYASKVRRWLGCRRRRGGKLLELTLPAGEPESKVLEMDFSPALQGVAGYLWRFPFRCAQDGQIHIKYGIMDRSGRASAARLHALLQGYVDRKEGGATPLPATVPGYPERYWQPFERSAGARGLVVGDAWGVDPLLGEGIAVAFEQAEYAARHLARAWRGNRRIARRYDWVYPLTATGWNLWFLKKLGDYIYGGHSQFWLGILAEDPGLSQLSRTRRFGGYGRFARHPFILTWIAGRHFCSALMASLRRPCRFPGPKSGT